uniref:Cation-transporting ATPase n=1 Tax=Angiostrongylus cantonensis TaxID=6313 RepID=A0A158P6R6_ANGCA
MAVDALVESITTYRCLPLWAHLYAAPYGVIYACWFYIWISVYDFNEYYELGLIGVAIIGMVQALLILFCHWFVGVKCALSCSDSLKATHCKVLPTPNNGWSELVPLRRTQARKSKLWFEFQKVHYTLDEASNSFSTVVFDSYRPMKYYQQSRGVESDDQLEEISYLLGDNKTEMVIQQFWDLFKERATAPFFVFQVFCVGLWCLEDMWYYSVFTLLMLMTFEATLVKAQLKNMQEIRNMGNKAFLIQAYRNHKWTKVRSSDLVSGDIVSVGRSSDQQTVPCDMVLLRGSCIVDESMLTGESVPQMKEPIEDLEKNRYFDIDSDSRLHVIFGGTKVVQVLMVLKVQIMVASGNCLGLYFYYLWIVGDQDEKRNKYKLFLECTLIITSVIPPELPIELSLAVNTSLIALQKLGVFCTEPFRIPFAGKIDICCFDKTGTLTTDNLVVEGIAYRFKGFLKTVAAVPTESIQVLACCHSLVRFDDDLVGDPLEKACLAWSDWSLTKGESVLPPKGSKQPGLKIFHRFHFSSAMKRMTVVAGYQVPGSQEPKLIVAVKGAPETLRPMYEVIPKDYDEVFTNLTRQGARVLAMGIKALTQTRVSEIRGVKREVLESNLRFAGFVVISCPLKSDTKAMIKEIVDSSHKVAMITGDNALTACNVAKVLKFVKNKVPTLILDEPLEKSATWKWKAVDESVAFDVVPFTNKQQLKKFFMENEFCLTGPAFSYLIENKHEFLRDLLMHVRVFARMAPKQKERIINEYKSLGCITLMCGDGTNDVGALKHSNVGVALLSHPYDATKAEQKEKEKREKTEEAHRLTHRDGNFPSGLPNFVSRRGEVPIGARPRYQPSLNMQSKLEKLMKELDEEERTSVTRLGDASIAAPFTSKYTICHVIKQGRCTLVTTLQMFKILALNALISAYSLSALYMDGVRFSDTQATIQGLLLAACFLFVSRSKPLKTLSKQRPMSNIFNAYTLFTVAGQFTIHFGCLLYVVKSAHEVNLESKFTPSVLNTSVYIISMALQICTFAVNYRGRPFMESLLENRAMLYSLLISGSSVFMLALGASEEVMHQFELVALPSELRNVLVYCVSFDLVACYMVDRVLNFLLGDMF